MRQFSLKKTVEYEWYKIKCLRSESGVVALSYPDCNGWEGVCYPFWNRHQFVSEGLVMLFCRCWFDIYLIGWPPDKFW